ncbi:MAG: orotidine-5'-phosphate decarboxylase [Actinomycetota bacterium]|nr:orotidine-5'-phosphate decarboxylase [Actinomycetota bacterium]
MAAAIQSKGSPICVGIDPRLEKMPAPLLDRFRAQAPQGCGCGRKEVAECFEEFSAAIIDAVAPHAAAVKLQLACFEQYGPPGFKAFRHLVRRAAKAGLIVIADAKRGDIGLSAQAYSSAFIGSPAGMNGPLRGLEIDALTVNPLFGQDGLEPFLDDCRRHGKGIFVLVKTSNPGSAQLQDLRLENGSLWYEHLAGLVDGWGAGLIGAEGYSSVGAVVGATHPEAIGRLRQLMPRAFFLLPGYGAQGAGAADVAAAFDCDGLGALVTASRSIIYAVSDADFAAAAGEAARRMKEELWSALG